MFEPRSDGRATINEEVARWKAFNRKRAEEFALISMLGCVPLAGSWFTTWTLVVATWCVGHFVLADRKWVGKKLWGIWHHPVVLLATACAALAAVWHSRSPFAIIGYAWFCIPIWYTWCELELKPGIEFASQTPKPAESQ